MMVGMFSRAAAISWPGAVLSHEARHSMPSSSAPSTATSMSLVIRSRADRMYPPRCPALVMKSLGAAVRTSKATPPACSMARLARRAISSRWLKQMASWEEEFTIAIFGLTRSASVRPSARHCARRVAQRVVPGSKLLRSGIAQLRSVARGAKLRSGGFRGVVPPGGQRI
jgi:hypothetical protein